MNRNKIINKSMKKIFRIYPNNSINIKKTLKIINLLIYYFLINSVSMKFFYICLLSFIENKIMINNNKPKISHRKLPDAGMSIKSEGAIVSPV